MAKMGRVVGITLGKIDKKAMLKFVEDSIKQLDKEKARVNPKEFEMARKTLRHLQKKIRKATPNKEFSIGEQEYNYLKTSLTQIVEMNKTAFDGMFFLKRWFYKLMSKNYEHLASVIKKRKS